MSQLTTVCIIETEWWKKDYLAEKKTSQLLHLDIYFD